MTTRNGPQSATWSFGQRPCVFVGAPDACFGFVPLRNTGAARGKLKRLPVRFDAQSALPTQAIARRRLPPDGAAHTQALLFAKLGAGEERDVRAQLLLDPATPPGTYQATLDTLKGQTLPASVRVYERRMLVVAPAQIELSVRPGASISLDVVAKNLGNVAVPIVERPILQFLLERGAGHYLHAAAKEHGKEGYEPVLDDFFARLSAAEPTPARATITSGAGSLLPQESRALTLQLQVPSGVGKGRSQRVSVALGDASLRLILHVERGEPHATEAEAEPEPNPASRAGASARPHPKRPGKRAVKRSRNRNR